jgi:hypothetical protein
VEQLPGVLDRRTDPGQANACAHRGGDCRDLDEILEARRGAPVVVSAMTI